MANHSQRLWREERRSFAAKGSYIAGSYNGGDMSYCKPGLEFCHQWGSCTFSRFVSESPLISVGWYSHDLGHESLAIHKDAAAACIGSNQILRRE